MTTASVSCFIVVLVGSVTSSVLPVDKCNLEDSACLKDAFTKALPVYAEGLPELGTKPLDVLEMDDLSFDLSGLQFTLKDGRLKGLKTAVFDNIKWDLKKQRLTIEFHVDCIVKGHYIAAGRILILPITGDGQMKLKLRNMEVKLHLDYEMKKDGEGKDHVEPKKYGFSFDVKDGAHFNLTNLFNGNKELSDPMLLFLNENWKQISTEFGTPMMDAAAKKIYENVKMFFGKIPIEDIAVV